VGLGVDQCEKGIWTRYEVKQLWRHVAAQKNNVGILSKYVGFRDNEWIRKLVGNTCKTARLLSRKNVR
jgi:hypothetical protein